jgi:hypothetical protein
MDIEKIFMLGRIIKVPLVVIAYTRWFSELSEFGLLKWSKIRACLLKAKAPVLHR